MIKKDKEKKDKIKLLNMLLAKGSAFADGTLLHAEKGIDMAMKEIEKSSSHADISSFAKSLLALYDPTAEVEFIEFGEAHFDTLFALPIISQAIKRLAGYPRAILLVYGLDSALKGDSGRESKKRRQDYSVNVEFIEDYALRYAKSFPNLEILFL